MPQVSIEALGSAIFTGGALPLGQADPLRQLS